MINLFSFSKKKIILKILFIAITLFSHHSFAITSRSLTILVEPNMAMAFTKIAKEFSQKYNTIVSINFNFSFDAISEIDLGESVDIVISGHPIIIESLKQKGLVDFYSTSYIAGDHLVLVTSKTNPEISESFHGKNLNLPQALEILNRKKSNLIIDSKDVAAGSSAENLIKKFSFSDINIFQKLFEDKSFITDLVKNSDGSYALLLLSQIKNSKFLKVIASDEANEVFYKTLIIAGDNMQVAREFSKFLKTDKVKKILKESGFDSVEPI